MGLTSALYTGLSGLDVNQTAMNVIGNNIANVNTTAFKSSSVQFESQFYVTDQGGSAPTSDFGGTDPNQRGLGAQVASIEENFTDGSISSTGQDTDMAIQGAGFFVVNGAGNTQYTRDGSFTLNSNDQLVTSGGQFVQGYGVDAASNVVPGKLQNITIPLGAASTASATQNVEMTGNLNAGGQIATGASVLNSQALTTVGGAAAPTAGTLLTDVAANSDSATPLFTVGQTYTLAGEKGSRQMSPETFTVQSTSTMGDLMNFFNGGLGIDTTVATTPTEPTPGVTLDPDIAGPDAVHLTIAGNTGNDNALTLDGSSFTSGSESPFTFTDGTTASGIANDPSGESIHTTAIVYDSLGNPVTVDITAVYQSSSDQGTTWQFYADSADNKDPSGTQVVGEGTLTFDNTGQLTASTGTDISMNRAGTGAKSPFTFNLDFSGVTALASQTSNMVMNKQDGSPQGSLTSFTVGGDGIITGSFSNGLTRTLGQVALATFNNPDGLVDNGGGLYTSSANSGAAVVGAPTALGAGQLVDGALEQSNVDISQEFVDMIVASTGFSASSRVITTSDDMLTELMDTSRQ
jgi:flagellar hook protein FlgE